MKAEVGLVLLPHVHVGTVALFRRAKKAQEAVNVEQVWTSEVVSRGSDLQEGLGAATPAYDKADAAGR